MKAIMVRQTGGPEVLSLEDVPQPQIKPDQVLLKVEAVGLNFADILNVAGEYLTRPRLPMIPGMEFAGTIEAVGSEVQGLQVGQRVAALGGSGALAQYAAVSARAVLPVPISLSAAEAAAFPVSYYTAYFALHTLGQAKAGEWLLVQAAGGALGTALVQIAVALGLKVVATASSPQKLALAQSLGAHVTFLNTDPDPVGQVLKATDGQGVNLIAEVVGGEGLAHSLRMLAYRGRLLMIGSASRQASTLSPVALMKKNQAVIGVWLTPFLQDPAAMHQATAFLMGLMASGQAKPVVGKVFSLEETPQAFEYVLSRQSSGKVIIAP